MPKIREIAETLEGEVEGDGSLNITGVCDLRQGRKKHLAYLSDKKYLPFLSSSEASAVLVSHSFKTDIKDKTLIRVKNPALSFFQIISILYPKNKSVSSVHQSVAIEEDAVLSGSCYVGANSSIGRRTRIGDETIISSCVSIGDDVVIGNNTTIKSNVSIYDGVRIGDYVTIESGTVIGSDGFGIYTDNGVHHQVPHIGSVIIENNVLIGANCCIDRGTIGNTIVGESTKIDNLIQIAHNVVIGRSCLIAAQVGIAGSTEVNDRVSIGGQVGIIGHLTIGPDSTIASKSAVFKSVKANSFVSGIPSREHKRRIKEDYLVRKLPETMERIKKLEGSDE